jgi:hypothetical protein
MLLDNKKCKKSLLIMKNALGIFEKTFQNLLTKFDLHVSFVLDVFYYYCCFLHTLLQSQIESNIKRLMWIIEVET